MKLFEGEVGLKLAEFLPETACGDGVNFGVGYKYFAGAVLGDRGESVVGWVLFRDSISNPLDCSSEFLVNSKGGLRLFKSLDSVAKTLWWADGGFSVVTG